MLCYGVVYVVKHKHSATVVYSNLLIKTSKISDIRMEATINIFDWSFELSLTTISNGELSDLRGLTKVEFGPTKFDLLSQM